MTAVAGRVHGLHDFCEPYFQERLQDCQEQSRQKDGNGAQDDASSQGNASQDGGDAALDSGVGQRGDHNCEDRGPGIAALFCVVRHGEGDGIHVTEPRQRRHVEPPAVEASPDDPPARFFSHEQVRGQMSDPGGDR